MNRKIKFRAWSRQSGKYLYTFDGFNFDDGVDEIKYLPIWELLKWPDIFVVQQYTGFKDVNGNSIYEGDIVKHDDYIDGIINCSIEYDNGRFVVKNKDRECSALFHFNQYIEIVGNIFENPELLNTNV